MSRVSRFRMMFYLRWVLWLVWALGWPVLIWYLPKDLLPLIIYCSLWIIGSWFGLLFIAPRAIMSRIWGIREAREYRLWKEQQARFRMIPDDEDEELDYRYDSVEDAYHDKYYARHMRWIEKMKERCRYEGGGPTGDDVYSSPYLWRKLPLSDFEMWAGDPGFNREVSEYITDWKEFRKDFPGLETFEYNPDEDEDLY